MARHNLTWHNLVSRTLFCRSVSLYGESRSRRGVPMDTPTYLVHDRSSRINCTKESPSGLSKPLFSP